MEATKIAPGSLKTIGIQAGAVSKTQVTAPGRASKKRAPNCLRACSQTGAGGWASSTAIPPIIRGIRKRVAGLLSGREYRHSAFRRAYFRGRRPQRPGARGGRLLRRLVSALQDDGAGGRAALDRVRRP